MMATFNVLVLGDSVHWGQGLRPEQKLSAHVVAWLKGRVAQNVTCTMLAHSGAVIAPGTVEQEKRQPQALQAMPLDVQGEVPLDYPSITYQVGMAAARLRSQDIHLILLNGGSNDLGVLNLINPLQRGEYLQSQAERFCGKPMQDLLRQVRAAFPQAGLVVTGYYPIISNSSDPQDIVKLFAASKEVGLWQESVASAINAMIAALGIAVLRQKLANLSSAWADGSTIALRAAVEAVNAEISDPHAGRALFAPVSFQPEDALEAISSYIWDGDDDDLCAARSTWADWLMKQRDLPLQARLEFPVASAGHPNRKGAQAYADAIIAALGPWTAGGQWNPTLAPAAVNQAQLQYQMVGAPEVPLGESVQAEVTMRAWKQDGARSTPVGGWVEMTNHEHPNGQRFPLNQPFPWEFHAHNLILDGLGSIPTTTRVRVLANGYDAVWVRW